MLEDSFNGKFQAKDMIITHLGNLLKKYVVVSLLSFFCLCETKTKCYLEAEILKNEISDPFK